MRLLDVLKSISRCLFQKATRADNGGAKRVAAEVFLYANS